MGEENFHKIGWYGWNSVSVGFGMGSGKGESAFVRYVNFVRVFVVNL